jgi:cell division protein FtsW
MFRTMGQRTGMKSGKSPSQAGGASASDDHQTASGKFAQMRVDVPTLLIVVMLMVFGIIMVYSASYYPSIRFYGGDPFVIVRRQAIFMLLGAAVAGALVFFSYRYYQRLAVLMMGGTILLLIAVLFTSHSGDVVQRTLIGKSVQPSELAKLVTIIYLSVWFFARRDQIHQVGFGLIPLAVMLGVLGGLIAVQPDISAAITVIILGGVMFFLAGADLKQLILLILVALVAGFLVYQISFTASARISGFLAGWKDPFRAPDQVQYSIQAFINGNWFGVGLGKGQTKLVGLSVAHTDSIFAVVGEELGMLGAVVLIILYSLLFWRGMLIARRAPDEMGRLLAGGISIWLAFEAFVNMASVVNLLPYAGNALPFISVGGSNLLMSLAAVGILLNISRLSVQTREENGRFFSAVVDLRGRNRRRSVSRSDRLGNAE